MYFRNNLLPAHLYVAHFWSTDRNLKVNTCLYHSVFEYDEFESTDTQDLDYKASAFTFNTVYTL